MYHYQECGLNDVWLTDGFSIEHDDDYGELVSIHDVEQLHKVIGLFVIANRSILNAAEIRFLRKEMDMSQKNLAGLLGVSENSVRGWEADRGTIGTPTDRFLRALYQEHAHGDGSLRKLVEALNKQDRRLNANSSMQFSYCKQHHWQPIACP